MKNLIRLSTYGVVIASIIAGYEFLLTNRIDILEVIPRAAASELEVEESANVFPTPDNSAELRKIRSHPQLRKFFTLWGSNEKGLFDNTWLGIPTIQNPLDVWITQEILFEVKPDFLVETGSLQGGSAALWATILAQINPAAKIISVDITDHVTTAKELPIVKKMVTFLVGSSTDPAIFEKIEKQVKGKKVVVILDSAHTREHVYEELKLYSKLVPVGSYLIVQDTGMVLPSPAMLGWANLGVQDFIKENDQFIADRGRERLVITNNPGGYLRRVR